MAKSRYAADAGIIGCEIRVEPLKLEAGIRAVAIRPHLIVS